MRHQITFEHDGNTFTGQSQDFSPEQIAEHSAKYVARRIMDKVKRAPASKQQEIFEACLRDVDFNRRAATDAPRQADNLAVLTLATKHDINASMQVLREAAMLHKQLDKAQVAPANITERVLAKLREAANG